MNTRKFAIAIALSDDVNEQWMLFLRFVNTTLNYRVMVLTL